MQADEATREAILDVQEQFWTALITRDRELFEAVLAPDFVGRSPGELNQSRQEFIDRLTSFPPAVGEITPQEAEVHIFGEMAVLTGVQISRLNLPDETVRVSRIILTNIFRQSSQGWLMVLSHSFEVVDQP